MSNTSCKTAPCGAKINVAGHVDEATAYRMHVIGCRKPECIAVRDNVVNGQRSPGWWEGYPELSY